MEIQIPSKVSIETRSLRSGTVSLKRIDFESEDSEEVEHNDAQYKQSYDYDDLCAGGLKDFSEEEFLRLRNIQKNYKAHYIHDANEEFDSASRYLLKQKLVGFSCELDTDKASFLQISVLKRGFAFNIKKLKQSEKARSFFLKFMKKRTILKVVQGSEIKFRALGRALGSSIKFESFLTLEEKLFTTRAASSINLSTMCLRLYKKKLDQDFVQWVGQSEFLSADDLHYALLEALSPLILFKSLRLALEASPPQPILMYDPSWFEKISPKFFVDEMLKHIYKLLKANGYESRYKKEKSYEGKILFKKEIVERCGREKRVLVTTDKYLVYHPQIINVIVYRGKKQFLQGKFFLK